MNRKTFIDRLMRLIILGGIGILTGFLVSRRKLVHGGYCRLDTVCSNCPELKGCSKDEAVTYRKNGRT